MFVFFFFDIRCREHDLVTALPLCIVDGYKKGLEVSEIEELVVDRICQKHVDESFRRGFVDVAR